MQSVIHDLSAGASAPGPSSSLQDLFHLDGMLPPAKVSIVAPTYNEAANIAPLVRRLSEALAGIDWEVIFVDDDSPDGTSAAVKQLAAHDRRIRCIRRTGRRGLAGACIEGILASSAPVVAVIDADLQHDERILPRMLEEIQNGFDLVIASRHVEGGAVADGLNASRAKISRVGTLLAQKVLHTECRDVMSGFFMMRREKFEVLAPALAPYGFKILADILATSGGKLRVTEVGYEFRSRNAGDSKFDARAAADFIGLLLSKWTGGLLPLRFVIFSLIGGVGVGVHLLALALFHKWGGMSFGAAQVGATLIAMTSNFLMNNVVTYRDAKLKGWALPTGLLKFYLVCSLGAFANLSISIHVFGFGVPWWAAGLLGIAMGSIWNFSISSALVWRKA